MHGPTSFLLIPITFVFAIAWTHCFAAAPPRIELELPIPPAQNQPWTAPEGALAPVVVSAITGLLKDGMADPRGCEYRKIEVVTPIDGIIKTHGWVLPSHDTQRYAIGWNGVIYPVAAVGAEVDLAKEFSAFSSAKGERRFRGYGVGWPMTDRGSLRADFATPIQAAFLLRLGYAQLARNVWNEGYADAENMKGKDPYAEMASIWLGSWFNRARGAYGVGDDASALSICRSLSPVVKKVEASAIARGLAIPWTAKMCGDNLWQLPILEADAERRIHEKSYTPVLKSGKPAGGPERIAALIRDLELVAAHQEWIPGETQVINDPIVQALVKEGQPAVESLLKCLLEDDRLTRSLYTEGMGFEGPIIPVYEAAYVALFQILNVSFPLFDHDSGGGQAKNEPRDLSRENRKELAKKIEAIWQQKKDEFSTNRRH